MGAATTADDEVTELMVRGWIRRLREMRAGGFSATASKVVPYADDAAADRLRKAVAAIGRVTESEDDAGRIRGTVRYGLAHASVSVAVDAVDDRSSRVIVIAGGEDAWGVGARSAIARIFDAVDRLDSPRYHPNRFGPKLVNAAIQFSLFCALLVGGLYVWFSLTR